MRHLYKIQIEKSKPLDARYDHAGMTIIENLWMPAKNTQA
jgi:hypothetical protein